MVNQGSLVMLSNQAERQTRDPAVQDLGARECWAQLLCCHFPAVCDLGQITYPLSICKMGGGNSVYLMNS